MALDARGPALHMSFRVTVRDPVPERKPGNPERADDDRRAQALRHADRRAGRPRGPVGGHAGTRGHVAGNVVERAIEKLGIDPDEKDPLATGHESGRQNEA